MSQDTATNLFLKFILFILENVKVIFPVLWNICLTEERDRYQPIQPIPGAGIGGCRCNLSDSLHCSHSFKTNISWIPQIQ